MIVIRDLEHLLNTLDAAEGSKIQGGVNVPAGPIWNNDDAKIKCPVVAAAAGGTWDGNWTTTIWGQQSVCNIV
ncbi:mannan-binding lectin [Nostoc sp. PCC 9305]|uniref:mannan-binding lectin n=1 Tax=Nostoc sp. PCC 9305 TaxID=296636 RepID=UPI0039C6A830